MDDYSEIKKQVTKSFLKRFYYDRWETGDAGLSLIVTNKCDHRCKYCYLQGQTKAPFPKEAGDHDNILNNCDKILDWLIREGHRPKKIDLFSGEIFASSLGIEIIEKILSKLDYDYICLVPSNMSFLLSDEKTAKVIDLMKRGKGRIRLSASIDGPFLEDNRPFANGYKRDKDFYHRLWNLCKEIPIGLHPMVYSEGIEHWIKTFDWFLENIPYPEKERPFSLYLLEIRNNNWSKDQVKEYGKFIRHVLRYILEHNLMYSAFNIISSSLGETGRGVGCSFQNHLELRLGDLVCVPCHRLMYEQFWYFKYDDNFEPLPLNTDFMIAANSFATLPVCESCLINKLCPKGCAGSQYETIGEPFVPIPSVCRLFHYKIYSIVDELKKLGLLDWLHTQIGTKKMNEIHKFMEVHKI